MPCRNAPSTMPWKNAAPAEPPMNARSHRCFVRLALARISNDTPRKIRHTSMKTSGRYSADSTVEYTSGKTANSAAPPSTSQVSLPSHTGATVFIIRSRSFSSGKNGKTMPMPRSKPSSTTYMKRPNAMIAAHMTVTSIFFSQAVGLGSGHVDQLIGGGQRAARAPGGLVARHAMRCVSRQRRTRAHQLEHVVDAGAEHEEVDHHEGHQRDTDLLRGQRRHRLRGAHHAVHDPRLATGFGGDPAGQQRDEAARAHRDRETLEPLRFEQTSASAQRPGRE